MITINGASLDMKPSGDGYVIHYFRGKGRIKNYVEFFFNRENAELLYNCILHQLKTTNN